MMYRASSETATWQLFWYEKNLQGDVVAVYDNNGVKHVSYTYDAWGNTTETRHVNYTAASYNPFRYRGYYYDSDISLYCLGTRWYSTQFRRFLSPDDISYLGANGDLNSYNLYAYCSNNPVNMIDPTGNFAWWIIAIIGVTTLLTSIGEIVAYNNAEEIYDKYKDVIQIENGVIYNSNQVTNPFHIWALSAYVRYYTDSGAKGTSYGIAIEWLYHNIGSNIEAFEESGKHLNFGKTILSDFKDHHHFPEIVFPIIMNATELVTNPLMYIYDVVRTLL